MSMRRMSPALLLAILALTAGCKADGRSSSAPAAPAAPVSRQPQPLDSADFVVRGIDAGSSAARALELLGAADSMIVAGDPDDPDVKHVRWDFADLSVHSWDGDAVGGITLSGPGAATHRGIRAGDALDAVRERYGEPSRTNEEGWIYLDPADPSELHMLRFRATAGRVTSIFVGTVLD